MDNIRSKEINRYVKISFMIEDPVVCVDAHIIMNIKVIWVPLFLMPGTF
jgi:hypothetical protein